MEKFVKGDVVVIPFPFSDLTDIKKRPALIIANLKGEDLILCQITSKNVKDEYAIEIKDTDFKEGSLKQVSNVRPNKLFTADNGIILYQVGTLKRNKMNEIIDKIIDILKI